MQPQPREQETIFEERLAYVMDGLIPLGGNRAIGLDGIIGLVPGAGLMATLASGSVMVMQGWRRTGNAELVAKIIGNVAIDALITVVPVVGDVGDFFFKANRRNAKLIRNAITGDAHDGADPQRQFASIEDFAITKERYDAMVDQAIAESAKLAPANTERSSPLLAVFTVLVSALIGWWAASSAAVGGEMNGVSIFLLAWALCTGIAVAAMQIKGTRQSVSKLCSAAGWLSIPLVLFVSAVLILNFGLPLFGGETRVLQIAIDPDIPQQAQMGIVAAALLLPVLVVPVVAVSRRARSFVGAVALGAVVPIALLLFAVLWACYLMNKNPNSSSRGMSANDEAYEATRLRQAGYGPMGNNDPFYTG